MPSQKSAGREAWSGTIGLILKIFVANLKKLCNIREVSGTVRLPVQENVVLARSWIACLHVIRRLTAAQPAGTTQKKGGNCERVLCGVVAETGMAMEAAGKVERG